MEKPEELVSPKAVTEELVKESMEQHQPADIAAAFFMRQEPKFIQLVNQLSNRGLRRLIMHLALGELANREYPLKDETEKSASYIGNELIFNRVIMQLTAEMQAVEEAQKENPNLLTEEQSNDTINNNESNKGESTNV